MFLLIKARKSAKITQQELADKLGKPQSFISKYENGERRLDVIEFMKVCKAIKINSAKILDDI